MMRWGRVVIVFLVLGAAVNVGVAWGFAVVVDVTNSAAERAVGVTDEWLLDAVVISGPGSTAVTTTRGPSDFSRLIQKSGSPERLLPSWSGLRHPTTELLTSEAVDGQILIEDRCVDGRGWPMRSMMCDRWMRIRGVAIPIRHEIREGIVLDSGLWPSLGPKALPLRPIPLGFVLNSLIYAAALWLLIPGPFVLRRSLRCHRGRCISCGYDLRGTEHERCPECGNPAVKAATA